MIYVLFVILYLFAVACEQLKNNKLAILAILCVILSVFPGLRSLVWDDTGVYVYNFLFNTPTILDYSITDKQAGFSEKGFFFLGVIVKTFTDNYSVYLLFVSFVTFIFIYKDLKQYSIFPFVGLCAYIARFYSGRNFIQIRAGVSYAILVLGIKYIQERDWKRYFLIVFIAWLFHKSAIAAVPLYFLSTLFQLKPKHIVWGLIGAFVVGFAGQGFIHNFIEDNASDLTIGTRYTEAGGEQGMVKGLGMLNPMIYFQCILLLSYTFLERKLKPLTKYYYSIRDAYFYSTLILICFCSYKVLSARTSTMFATMEISIIPSLIYMFNKKNRFFAFVLVGVALTFIFYMNFRSHV